MNAERALISKIAATGKGAADLMADGVREDHFVHEDCLLAWQFICKHTEKYGKQPTSKTLLENVKFNFEIVDEPLAYIFDRFVETLERRDTIEFMREVLAPATNDTDMAGRLSDLMLEQGRKMKNMMPGSDVARLTDADRRIADWEERKASGQKYTGLEMGIHDIDEATLGIQPHELISVVGWQGTGKSTLVQWIMFNVYMQNKRCLYISLEMTAEALMRKWDQMFNQFSSYKHLKTMNLTDDEIKRWKAWSKEIQKNSSRAEIMVASDGGAWTVDRVHGEILKHQPDIVAVDYLTLMENPSTGRDDEARWANLTKMTRELKQVALRTETPIIAISQTNRESAKDGAKMENIGGSYSVGADSDIVIGLHQDPERREEQCMEVRLIKNRDGEILVSEISWDMEKMSFNDDYATEQLRKSRAAKKEGELKLVESEEEKKKREAHEREEARALRQRVADQKKKEAEERDAKLVTYRPGDAAVKAASDE